MTSTTSSRYNGPTTTTSSIRVSSIMSQIGERRENVSGSHFLTHHRLIMTPKSTICNRSNIRRIASESGMDACDGPIPEHATRPSPTCRCRTQRIEGQLEYILNGESLFSQRERNALHLEMYRWLSRVSLPNSREDASQKC